MKYYESFVEGTSAYTLEGVLDYFNERIRIDLYTGDVKAVIDKMEQLAQKSSFSKLIIKGKREHLSIFINHGYTLEASIPGYFQGHEAYFCTKYRSNDRRNSLYWIEEDEIIRKVTKEQEKKEKELSEMFELRRAGESDAEELAQVFGNVFQIYPTPLNQPHYIKKTMQEETVYYVYTADGKIVSAASAEINSLQGNAELTNCATLPEFRKHGLMKQLLRELEEELRARHIFCAYTIARALSYGMNAAFAQLGYMYTGRLVNNCYIFDKIEDMNVWVKDLSK